MRRLRDPDQLLFFALLALHVLPLWVFPFFPSQDGPAHLENAVILRDYHRPDRSLLPHLLHPQRPTSTPTGSATSPCPA